MKGRAHISVRLLAVAGVAATLATMGGGAAYSQSGFQDPGSGPPGIDRLDAKPRLVDEGGWVDFIAQASDPDDRGLKYRWDFGDGEAAEDAGAVDVASITHRYRDDGQYRVSLRVDAADGEGVEDSLTVLVANVDPEIRDVSRTGAAVEGSTISFSAAVFDPGPDDELTYAWDFGDGGTGEGQNPDHAFDKDGTYPVTVEVDDGDGGEASHTIIVIVGSGYEYDVTGGIQVSEHGPMAGLMGIQGEAALPRGEGRPGYCYLRFYFDTQVDQGSEPDVTLHLSAIVRGGLVVGTYAVGAVKTVPDLFYTPADPWEDQNRSPERIFGWMDTGLRFDHADGWPDTFVSQGGALSVDYFDGTRIEGSFDLSLVELGPEFAGQVNQRPIRNAHVSGHFAHQLSWGRFGASNTDIYDCIEDETFAVAKQFPDRNDENIDPEDPELEVTFTAPYDPATLDEETFRVEYRLDGGDYEQMDGFLERVDERTFRFEPAFDLLDGVLYCARIKAGEEGVRGLDGEVLKVPPAPKDLEQAAALHRLTGDLDPVTRTFRACMAGGRPFEEAYEWGFATTVELEHVRPAVYQVVENAKLVPGKHTLTRVYARWAEKEGVHPDVQVKRFRADVFVEASGWPVYTPKHRVIVTRPDQFDSEDKANMLNTLNFYGWLPTKRSGTSTVEATIRPTDQNRKPPEEHKGETVETIEHWDLSPGLVFDYYVLPVGQWSEGVPPGDMGEIHRNMQEGARFVTQNFPFVWTRARYRGVAEVSEPWFAVTWEGTDHPRASPLGLVSQQSTWATLGWDLYEFAKNTTAHAIVGIVPEGLSETWAGLMVPFFYAPTHHSLVLGGRRVIILEYDGEIKKNVVAHEFGHFFGLCHTLEKPDLPNACYPYDLGHESVLMLPGGQRALLKSQSDGNPQAHDLRTLTPLMDPVVGLPWEDYISDQNYRFRLFDTLGLVFRGSPQVAAAPNLPAWVGAGLATGPGIPVVPILPPNAGEQTAGKSSASPAQEESVLSVSGLLSTDGSSAVIRRIRPASGSAGEGSIGDEGAVGGLDYTLELRGSDGSAMATVSATPLQGHVLDGASSDGTALFFEGVLPNRPDAVEVVLLADSRVLTRRERTPSAPVVTELRVESTVGGAGRVAWEATDADGDSLTFDVYYSPTGEAAQSGLGQGTPEDDWRPMAAGITRTTLDFRTADLERGPSPAVKVLVSDGFNVAQRVEAMDLDLPLAPLATSPGPGGHLDPEERLSVYFSTDLAQDAVNPETLSLLDEDGEPVAADVDWSATTGELTLTPVAPLDPGKQYTATLRAGLRDRTGGALPEDITWTFSTLGEPQETVTGPAPSTPVFDPGLPADDGSSPAVEDARRAPLTSVTPAVLAPEWDHPAYLTGEQAGTLGRDGVRFLWGRISGALEEEFAGNQNDASALADITCEGAYGMRLSLFDASTFRDAKRSVVISLGEPLRAPGSYPAYVQYMQTANLLDVYAGEVDFKVLALQSAESPGGPRLIVEVRGEGLRTQGGKTGQLHLRLDLNTACEE